MRRLPVGLAGDDGADQVLHVPAARRLTNSAASQSSSSGCVGHSPCEPRSSSDLRESGAEELPPQAVDEDARGQRIVRRDQPVGQIEPRGAAAAGVELAEEGGDGRLARSRPIRPSSCRARRMRVSAGVVASATPPRAGSQLRAGAAASSQPRQFGSIGLASGAAHSKCAATAVFCASVRFGSSHAQGAQHGVRNLFALLGGGPGVLAGREHQPEASDGRAAEFGIVPEAHGHHGVAHRSQPARRSAAPGRPSRCRRTRRLPQPVFGSPIDGRERRMLGARRLFRLDVPARKRHLAPADFGFDFGDHQAIRAARQRDVRAGSRPARLRARALPRARAGLQGDGVGFVVGIRTAATTRPLPGRAGEDAAFVAGDPRSSL